MELENIKHMCPYKDTETLRDALNAAFASESPNYCETHGLVEMDAMLQRWFETHVTQAPESAWAKEWARLTQEQDVVATKLVEDTPIPARTAATAAAAVVVTTTTTTMKSSKINASTAMVGAHFSSASSSHKKKTKQKEECGCLSDEHWTHVSGYCAPHQMPMDPYTRAVVAGHLRATMK